MNELNIHGELPFCDWTDCRQLAEWTNVSVANVKGKVYCEHHKQEDAAFWIEGWGSDVVYRKLCDGTHWKIGRANQ